jgi:hypothetical protein
MPGVKHVVKVGNSAVAVVAERWWQAKTALDARRTSPRKYRHEIRAPIFVSLAYQDDGSNWTGRIGHPTNRVPILP